MDNADEKTAANQISEECDQHGEESHPDINAVFTGVDREEHGVRHGMLLARHCEHEDAAP